MFIRKPLPLICIFFFSFIYELQLANTLVFVLNFVTSHRDAAERIFAEFLEHENTAILQDSITNAVFTKACLQETYRLQPTAFCLARILEEDTKLSGYDLKTGVSLDCQI